MSDPPVEILNLAGGGQIPRRRRGAKTGRPSEKVAQPLQSETRRALTQWHAAASKAAVKLPKQDRLRPEVSQLWLRSRLETSNGDADAPTYLEAGREKPLTLDNIKLAIQLVPHLWEPFWGLFWASHRYAVLFYLVRRLIRSVIPVTKCVPLQSNRCLLIPGYTTNPVCSIWCKRALKTNTWIEAMFYGQQACQCYSMPRTKFTIFWRRGATTACVYVFQITLEQWLT